MVLRVSRAWVEISFSIVAMMILMKLKSFSEAKQVFSLIRAEKNWLYKLLVYTKQVNAFDSLIHGSEHMYILEYVLLQTKQKFKMMLISI